MPFYHSQSYKININVSIEGISQFSLTSPKDTGFTNQTKNFRKGGG